jgi:hypothetical protein
LWCTPHEALGMCRVAAARVSPSPVEYGCGSTVMHHRRGGEQGEPRVVVPVVVPVEEPDAECTRVLETAEPIRELGRYFSVLNCASENGLSLLTEGLEWVLVTPRSPSSNATAFA